MERWLMGLLCNFRMDIILANFQESCNYGLVRHTLKISIEQADVSAYIWERCLDQGLSSLDAYGGPCKTLTAYL